MTEAEWLACTEPTPMLVFLRGKVSDRKLRLFAVACCRRLWQFTEDERSRAAVESAEGFADNGLSQAKLNEAAYAAGSAFDDTLGTAPKLADIAHAFAAAAAPDDFTDPAFVAATNASHDATNAAATLTVEEGKSEAWWAAKRAEAAAQCGLLHDIFGPLPFRPVAFDSSWKTSTALALAEAIYADRAFDRLPILADALEDARCDQADILTHLRGDGPHVRGCWALDLVLGKE